MENQKLNIQLTVGQVNEVLSALSKPPYELIALIREQAQNQLQQFSASEPGAPVPQED